MYPAISDEDDGKHYCRRYREIPNLAKKEDTAFGDTPEELFCPNVQALEEECNDYSDFGGELAFQNSPWSPRIGDDPCNSAGGDQCDGECLSLEEFHLCG